MAGLLEQQGLISRYNHAFGRCYKYTSKNKSCASGALDTAATAGFTAADIVAYWKYIRNNPTAGYGIFSNDFCNDCYKIYGYGKERTFFKFMKMRPDLARTPNEGIPAVPEAKTFTFEAKQEEPKMDKQTTDGIVALGAVLSGVIQNLGMDELKDSVAKELKDEVMKWVQDTYGPIERKTTVVFNGKKSEVEGVVHEKFDEVLNLVALNIPAFLTGPAGSGKNVLCQQIAQCLGLPFYFSNAVTQEYKILGFTDANGRYQETQFYKAFKDGGLFMLDEIDASNPEVLNVLNAAIANRYQDFPAPIGFVKAHPNFRIVAAGNTYGTGADYDYVGRTQLDAATLNRFGVVHVDYDPRIEESVALGNKQLLDFCRAFRRACKKAGIRCIVSYRNIGYMAQLAGSLPVVELVRTFLTKGLEKGDIQMLKGALTDFGEYTEAIDKLAREA